MFNILACEENPLIAWVHCSEWVWQTQHKPEEVSARIQTSSLRQNLMVRNPSWTSWTSWTTEQEQTRLTHWVCQADTPFHPLVITMFIHVPCQNCHTIWRWNLPFSDTPKYHLGCMSQHIPIISHQFPCEIPMNSDPPPACSVHFRPLGQQTCPSSKALLNRIASKLQNPIGWSSDISDIIGIPSDTRFQRGPFCGDALEKVRRWDVGHRGNQVERFQPRLHMHLQILSLSSIDWEVNLSCECSQQISCTLGCIATKICTISNDKTMQLPQKSEDERSLKDWWYIDAVKQHRSYLQEATPIYASAKRIQSESRFKKRWIDMTLSYHSRLFPKSIYWISVSVYVSASSYTHLQTKHWKAQKEQCCRRNIRCYDYDWTAVATARNLSVLHPLQVKLHA